MAAYFVDDEPDPLLPASRSLALERKRRDDAVTLLSGLTAKLQYDASGKRRPLGRRLSIALKTVATEIQNQYEREVTPHLRTAIDFYPLFVSSLTNLLEGLRQLGLTPAQIAALCVYGTEGRGWHPRYVVPAGAGDSEFHERYLHAAQWVRTTISRERKRTGRRRRIAKGGG